MCEKAVPGLKVPSGLHPSALSTWLALPHGDSQVMQGLCWSRTAGGKRESREGVFLNYLPLPACLLSVGLAKVSFKYRQTAYTD